MGKIWEKESSKINKIIEDFTIGNDPLFDLDLAPYDVLGSLAHTSMLEKIGLLEPAELKAIQAELGHIYSNIEKGHFTIEEGVEDVHSQIEMMLTEKLGDLGKKIHSGRSRNDQVLVDLKLYMRDQIEEITSKTETLIHELLELADKNKKNLLPGYTHLQIGMPASFGQWFAAYAESLTEDLEMLLAAYQLANKNPLGSGAGYGTSFPLDREMTTELLGFNQPHIGAINAQMSRGKTELFLLQAINALANSLGKLAMDVCLYNSQNFGFIQLPAEMTTGSSIMPHKKNPDVAELLRGKANKLKGAQTEMALLITNLPSGYHRDLQLTKEIVFPAINEMNECLFITHFMVKNMKVKEGLLDDPKYDLLFSVEQVNKLVLEGMTFRDAYVKVGNMIDKGEFKAPSRELNHTHLGSIGNLGLNQIKEQLKTILDKFDFSRKNDAIMKLINIK